MTASRMWPGRLLTDIAHGNQTISPVSLLSSPVLWLTSGLSFVIMYPWIGTTIHWTDSGELIASAVTLGIPHPTGYPLLSIISRSVLTILPWADPVSLLHYLSAVFIALSAGLVSILTIVISADGHRHKTRAAILAPAISAGLLFATSITVWSQAVSYEVYGLQALLYAIILVTTMIAVREMRGAHTMSRWWVLAGLFVGFGFANHMMTLYVIPGLVWYVWKELGRPSRLRMVVFFGAMMFALSVYAYLFLRAGIAPPLNWGDPSTVDDLIAHVTGKQYRVWMFSGWDVMKRSAGSFFSSFPADVGWGSIILSLVGFGFLWSHDRRKALLLLFLFLFTVLYAWNYDIHDIETYFILAIMTVSILAGFGIWSMMRKMTSYRPIVLTALPFVLIALNILYRLDAYPRVDEESPEHFARSVLEDTDPHGTIITGRWDFLYSPLLALQHVENLRTDVQIIDLHLLRDRSWYVRALHRRLAPASPDLERAASAFEAELRKFERGEPFVVQLLQQRWMDYLSVLLTHLYQKGAVMIDHEIVRGLPHIFQYVPDGYLLRAVPKDADSILPGGVPDYYPIGAKNDEFARSYRRFCSTTFLNHALYARSAGDSAAFKAALDQAGSIDPQNPLLSLSQDLPTR